MIVWALSTLPSHETPFCSRLLLTIFKRLWFFVAFMMPLPGLHLAVQSATRTVRRVSHPCGRDQLQAKLIESRWHNCHKDPKGWFTLLYQIINYHGPRLANTLELRSVLSGTNLLHNGTWFWASSGCDQTTSDNMRRSDKRCCIAMPLYWDHGNLRVPPQCHPPQKIGPKEGLTRGWWWWIIT